MTVALDEYELTSDGTAPEVDVLPLYETEYVEGATVVVVVVVGTVVVVVVGTVGTVVAIGTVVVVGVCTMAITTIDVFCHQHTPVRGQRNIPLSLSAHPKNGRLVVARARNAPVARHLPDDDSVISRLNVLTHICGAAPRTGHTSLNCEAVSQRLATA